MSPAHLKTRFHHWLARRRADRIITVSEHARKDLIETLGLPPAKLAVVYEAADPRFHETVGAEKRRAARGRHGLEGGYFFYVGGWERRKNVPFLLKAFAEAELGDAALVLGGGRPEELSELARLAGSLGISGRVRLLGWIPEEDLPALYAEALAFVYPSAYEGFGLQLCEAMAAGCPVLAARASCLPEILGGGGETFSLSGTAELSQLLRRVAADENYRRELSAKAGRRAKDFSWQETARRTIEVYQSLAR